MKRLFLELDWEIVDWNVSERGEKNGFWVVS
jgi:hypothetical protein